MIILYTVGNKSPYKGGLHNLTELCGNFTSLEHFKKFVKIEEYYNRFVIKHEVLKN
jgi:hypothetical protein